MKYPVMLSVMSLLRVDWIGLIHSIAHPERSLCLSLKSYEMESMIKNQPLDGFPVC